MISAQLRKKVGRGFLHLCLILGSVLFSIPFLWLMSTSAKVPDEMFPPKWVPQIPQGVVESPYIALRENEYAVKPVNVAEDDWERAQGPAKEAISHKIVSMEASFPDFYRPYLKEDALASGIFSRLVRRTPDELFSKVNDVIASWFYQNTDDEMVRTVFEQVYRRAALSDVAFHGWDVVTVEYYPASELRPWKVIDGDAVIVDRPEGLLRPAQEIHYSFKNKDRFSVQAVFPFQMAPENLKKVVVSNNPDRSWHTIWATIEVGGETFKSTQAAYMGLDRWQDIVWQKASEADHGVEIKSWRRIEPAGPSDFHEPGKIRLTLEFREAPRAVATFNKYTFNYREVLRMVPLAIYVKNSVILVVLNILGQILASSVVAFAFARLTWPARDVWFVLVLATLMIPPQVTMIPVFLIFKTLGWYNSLQPLWVGAFFGSAFYIFLLRQFMKGIPKDLEDSAKIDGCGYFGIYWRIILPLIKPALATIAIFTFMGTWNDFMGPLIYLSDQDKYPLSLGLFSLQAFNLNNYGLMMAASVMMTVPVIALFFAAQRQFIQGVTLTGLKG